VNQTLAYTDEAFLAEVSLHAKLPCKRTTLAEPTGSVSCLGTVWPARSDCKPVQHRRHGRGIQITETHWPRQRYLAGWTLLRAVGTSAPVHFW